MQLKKFGLNSTALKLIALITMIIDHVGAIIVPELTILRQIGRIAFPIYAFLIGEGCIYSKNKTKYLIKMLITFFTFEMVSFFVYRQDGPCVLYGFACTILITIIVDWINKNPIKRRVIGIIPITILFLSATILNSSYISFAIAIPLIVCYTKNKTLKFSLLIATLLLLSLCYGGNQWFCLISMVPILMYNGKKGPPILFKDSFYIIYPLHYAIIGIINALI